MEPQQNAPTTWLRTKLMKTTGYLVLTTFLSIISTCGSHVWSFMDTRKLKSVEQQIQDDMESLDNESTSATWLRTKLTRARDLITGYLVLTVVLSIVSTCGSCALSFADTWKLESVERQIQNDMESLDYESAYLNTKELEPSASSPSEKKEYWSQKRTEYQDTIIELKRERDSSDPSYIPAPESSEDLLGRNYDSVVRRFEESGFTNVKTVAESLPRTRKVPTGRPGRTRTEVLPEPVFYSWTRGSVSEIEFGCLTSFTIEDHCRPDEEIVVHYHADGNEPIVIPAPTPPEVTHDLKVPFDPDLTFELAPDDQS